jgi:hypothetical protein
MNALPWLVVDGALVWRAGLSFCVAAGIAATSLRPRIAAWRAARRVRAALGEPHRGPLTGGAVVTLTGTLLAKDERVLRYEDGGEAAAAAAAGEPAARAAQLAVLVGDAVIALEGPITLLSGSRESWPGRPVAKLSAAVRERAGALLELHRVPVFRSVAPGDRVRVRGVLREEAAEDGTTYRDAAKRWAFGGDGGPLLLACERAPRVTGPARAAFATPLLYGAAAFLAIFGLGGEAAMTLAQMPAGPVAPEKALSFAAATPFRRNDALGALVHALDAQRAADPAALEARDRLHAMRGETAARAEMWIAQGDPQRGADLAARAGRPDLEAKAWYAIGEFARAEEAWRRFPAPVRVPEARFAVGIEILAGHLEHAAAAARVLEQALRNAPAENEAQRDFAAERGDTAHCLAAALDARRGLAEGWEALRAAAAGRTSLACAVLRIDLLEGPRRSEAVKDLRWKEITRIDVPREWPALLAAEVDPAWPRSGLAATFDPGYDATVPNGGFLEVALPAVDRAIAEDLARRPPADRSAPILARAALFAALTGDTLGGRHLALSFGRGDDVEAGELRAAADAGIIFPCIGGEVRPGPLFAFTCSAEVQPLIRLLVHRPPPDEDEKRAWSLAAAGDGEGLGAWLARPHAQPGTFLRYGAHGAPHVKRGRDALLRVLRWGYRPPTEGFWPTERVVHLVNFAEATDALQPRPDLLHRDAAAHFREAILRRETAVPLAVLERL